MLSVDLTSSGLGAGTWVEGSWGGLTAACCRAACGAVEVCAAEVKLKNESTAAKVRSLNPIRASSNCGLERRDYIPARQKGNSDHQTFAATLSRAATH